MDEFSYNHGAHSKYVLKYHFVFCTKYRRKVLTTQRFLDFVKAVFDREAERIGFRVDTSETDADHIHVLVAWPMQASTYAAAYRSVHRWLLDDVYKKNVLWSSGYFVATTGQASTETSRRYVENQG